MQTEMGLAALLQQNQDLKQVLRSVLAQAPVLDSVTIMRVRRVLTLYDSPNLRDFLSPLPRDVLLLIFSCLDYCDVSHFSLCSHLLQEVSRTEDIWAGLMRRRWPSVSVLSEPRSGYRVRHSLETKWFCHRPVVSTLKGYRGTITSISLLPQSTSFIATSDDGSAGLWDYQDNISHSSDLFQQHHRQTKAVYRTASFYGHGGPVWASAVTSSAKLATGSSDMTVKIWGKAGKCEGTLRGHSNWVTALAAVGERVVSGSYDATIRVWDVENRLELASYQQESPENIIYSLDLTPVHIVTGSHFPAVTLRDLETGEVISRLYGHEDAVSSVQIAENYPDILVSGGKDQTVRLWDKRSGGNEETMRGHTSNVMCLAIEWEAKRIVSGSHDKTICVWDLRKPLAPRNALMGHSEAVFCLRCTDNKIISGSSDQSIKVWNFNSC